ncbi:MAG: hypothetical protein K9K65_06865 [Desulfarculaceae bacterium]|nr:hypothetical protein [Desulfarculaceae bacterium]MCF8049043.1 hypothetical protein [Desulfarculaceae bacterium]MCF8064993.1 hypothetical protein [Desulfarculaceae bacterium]MCF8097549.1 hypothetical protein [Desulfarculaceae bacterium]MCF8122204.1 hypothetical protein [Desulfarculaceae bacterium]
MKPELPPVEELVGSWTLITGEVNTGKTGLLSRLMADFAAQDPGRMALIDMAPELTRGVGGKLSPPPGVNLKVCAPAIIAPRLTGKTPEEVLALAKANAARLEEAFEGYLAAPAVVLFINDVSLYLQAGDPAKLYQVLEATPTVVINGYLGASLGGGEMGEMERRRMEELAARCVRVYRLA